MFNANQIFEGSDGIPVFAAPLAGITDKPFRKILRRFAPTVPIVTEMISCHSITRGHKNCVRNLDKYDDEGLIGAQIFGAAPELMADAAKILRDNGAKWIDINMGCPVPKVATRAGAGAFLMRDHKLAGQIIDAVVRVVDIPVSVKTRLGWDDEHHDWTDLARIASECGAGWLTVHGRTRAQGYSGAADWGQIKEQRAKSKEQIKIPIVFNGDIKTVADLETVAALGADGAMVGRALLGAPWKLGELIERRAQSVDVNMRSIILEHLELVLEYYGERAGVPLFRKHAAWYSAGMKNSSEFRIAVNRITDANMLRHEISRFFDCNDNS